MKNIFSFCRLLLCLCNGVFCLTEVSQLYEVSFIFGLRIYIAGSGKKILDIIQAMKTFDLQYVLPARCARSMVEQKLQELPTNDFF